MKRTPLIISALASCFLLPSIASADFQSRDRRHSNAYRGQVQQRNNNVRVRVQQRNSRAQARIQQRHNRAQARIQQRHNRAQARIQQRQNRAQARIQQRNNRAFARSQYGVLPRQRQVVRSRVRQPVVSRQQYIAPRPYNPVVYRPAPVTRNQIYVAGRYELHRNSQVWVPAHWIQARPGYTYVGSSFAYNLGRRIFTPARWVRNRLATPRRVVYRY